MTELNPIGCELTHLVVGATLLFRAELASERRARKRRQVALQGGHGSDSEEEEEEDDEELITASTRTAGR